MTGLGPRILELGHSGLWVDNLEKMKDFYTHVVGLTVTDENPEQGMVFLTSRPEVEHHEFVLARGRVGGPEVKVADQFSWRVATWTTCWSFTRTSRPRASMLIHRSSAGDGASATRSDAGAYTVLTSPESCAAASRSVLRSGVPAVAARRVILPPGTSAR